MAKKLVVAVSGSVKPVLGIVYDIACIFPGIERFPVVRS